MHAEQSDSNCNNNNTETGNCYGYYRINGNASFILSPTFENKCYLYPLFYYYKHDVG